MAGATKAQLTEGITMRSNSGTKRWLLSALLGGITLVPFGQTFAADPLEVVPESSEAEADAIAFRETFGLASQLDLIREAALDPSYSADIYGVPLSAAEINELLRRAEIQASLGPAIRFAADLETYGGTYIDQLDDGRPVFLFADDPDKYTASIASRLPKDTAFRARQVQRTEAALLATQASLDAAWEALAKEGIEVVSTGIVTNANIVRVGVRGLTTGAEERLQGEFGPGLVVLEDSPGGADACVDHNNCRPMKGGLAINASISGTPCTSGYVVKRVSNGQLHLLTAGHCLDPLVSDPFDTTWLHHADSFGRSREETWLKNGTRDADVGLITIFSPEYPTDRNQFYYGPTAGTIVKEVVNWADAVEQVIGSQACRFGRTSLRDCDVITAKNVSHVSCVVNVGCMTVSKTNEMGYDSQGGDSGGPVFYPQSLASNKIALGTHVHSTEGSVGSSGYSWWSPFDTGRNTFNALFGYTYTLCITDAC